MLSIVIPTCNRLDLLCACLSSVHRHAPAATEVIVVADGVPAPDCRCLVSQFPAIRLIRLPKRRGFCAAANSGIAAARNPIVEMLNDDTEVLPGWAEAGLHTIGNPSIAAIAPLVLQWPHGLTIDSAGDEYHVSGVARKRGHGQPLSPEFLQAGPVFGASACGAFYRRDVLLEVGGFPENFGAYFDDIDLSFRLRRAGFSIWYEPAARILHHGSASHETKSRRLLEQQSRNEERVFWRNLSRAQLWQALPQHAAVLTGKALKRWSRGEFLPFLAGRLRALAEVAGMLKERWT